MFPYINLSESVTIGSYGLMLAIAYLVGRAVFLSNLFKLSPKAKNTEILIILLLVLGVIGAKLMFIAKNPDKAQLLFNGTGFSSQGALLGALLATLIFTYWQKIKLSIILDAAAPAAILAYTFARMGCFLSGDDCYGVVSDLPWAMSFPDGLASTTDHVHPLPLYEMIYSIIIFLILNYRKTKDPAPYSQFFLLFLLWGFSRFFIEFISTNPKLLFSMSGSQIGALLMFISAIVFWLMTSKKKPT